MTLAPRNIKVIEDKIMELKDKGFAILEAQEGKNPFKKVSLRSIKLVINALEYTIGKHEDLMVFDELKKDFQ